MKMDWTDIDTIQQLLMEYNTRQDVVGAMGYHPKNNKATTQLNDVIEEHGLTTNFVTQKMPDRYMVLPDVISDCFSYSDVIRACGLADVGNNHKTVKKYIKQFGLDVSHFRQGPKLPSNKIPTDELFVENSGVARATIRRRIITECIIEYICADCGMGDKWNNKPITLQLEHKNGDNTDNRLENLEFLCPNCHSQTDTWGAKGREV